MFLSSPGLGEWFDLRYVYDKCGGENISPGLKWGEVPAAAESLALTVHDPDAPVPGGWWHWLIVNIPTTLQHMPENAGEWLEALGAVQTLNSYGEVGYGGPCPPVGHGPHRYVFTLWALDASKLPVQAATPPEAVAAKIQQHALDKASFVSLYERK